MKNKKQLFEDIIIFITFFISIMSIILPKYIGDLDEIWNYNFANCISKGLIPYKDFNMVITPFLSLFEGIVLKIFPNELIIMRILAIILSSSILFIFYKILVSLKINKNLSIIVVFAIEYLLKEYFCIDYNFFVLFLSLLIILFEIKKINSEPKDEINLLIGILARNLYNN